jgi:hypothetical protein
MVNERNDGRISNNWTVSLTKNGWELRRIKPPVIMVMYHACNDRAKFAQSLTPNG